MAQTIFDKILAKEIPAKVVFENDVALAFEDINPVAPVHVLVIPKKPTKNFTTLGEFDPEFIGRYMLAIAETARVLGLEDSGYRMVFNNGPDALQSVDYLHCHIVAGTALSWPPGV